MKSELKNYKLKRLADTFVSGQLRVNREYQRGLKWRLPQRQALIDSLLRGYRLPLFYVHLVDKRNEFTELVETTPYLVDGQQRLHAIAAYLQNKFGLVDPQAESHGMVLPTLVQEAVPWDGKKYEELAPEDRQRLLDQDLQVVEMREEVPNEVRDLFIRLQAGTPLTAQEKRDAWPGNFTTFVIRHAGKPGHDDGNNPKPFFKLVPQGRQLNIDDGDHSVDGLADRRKFFAGLAMTVMLREREQLDFVDLKGKTINKFYTANFDLDENEDPAAKRVLRTLERVAQLRGFDRLLQGPKLSHNMAFHLALLVDSLDCGDYVPVWRDNVVDAFVAFQKAVAEARLHYRQTSESLPHYERFASVLAGGGSDTADVIRRRHAFFLAQMSAAMKIRPRDENRLFGSLEKEVIWNRDRRACQNPECNREVPFGEATVHHVTAHHEGGDTVLQNGVLVCRDCHAQPILMQRLTHHFQDYLQRTYANLPAQANGGLPHTAPITAVAGGDAAATGRGERRRRGRRSRARLRIKINWQSLAENRPEQTIFEDTPTDSIVEFLAEVIETFGDTVKRQLTQVNVIRYPLSNRPEERFVNQETGEPYGSVPIPGTDLFLCPLASNLEKVRRLRECVRQLTLPGGRQFPEESVEFSTVENVEGNA